MNFRRFVTLSLALLPFFALAGCGSATSRPPSAPQNVTAQIEGLGDAVGSEEMFAAAFVPGAAPENREDYGNFIIQIIGEPEINDDLAVVSVKLTGGVVSAQLGDKAKASGGDKAETESVWTVQKVGEEWKIQDAPLP